MFNLNNYLLLTLLQLTEYQKICDNIQKFDLSSNIVTTEVPISNTD